MFKETMQPLLARADIRVGGDRPTDIIVHDERLYRRVALYGSLGLGESYMDKWWDAEDVPGFTERVLRADLDRSVRFNLASAYLWSSAHVMNLQSKARAFMVGEQHYDIGNELYRRMLDPTMSYSCAYWREPLTGKPLETLEEAQKAKLRLIGLKLRLKPGMKVLELGCGWGGLAKCLAEEYGVHVVGLTVSKEQAEYAQNLCRHLPVSIKLEDYRELGAEYDGAFDRAVSVGMFEHVGPPNYGTYMRVVHRSLKPIGLFLLHSIGGDGRSPDAWIHRYIFPNGVLPAEAQIAKAYHGRFAMEDWHNFGPDYAKTLAAWRSNFVRYWPELVKMRPDFYDERFFRKWIYYLSACEGAFRARAVQLWQIVLSKGAISEVYPAIR